MIFQTKRDEADQALLDMLGEEGLERIREAAQAKIGKSYRREMVEDMVLFAMWATPLIAEATGKDMGLYRAVRYHCKGLQDLPEGRAQLFKRLGKRQMELIISNYSPNAACQSYKLTRAELDELVESCGADRWINIAWVPPEEVRAEVDRLGLSAFCRIYEVDSGKVVGNVSVRRPSQDPVMTNADILARGREGIGEMSFESLVGNLAEHDPGCVADLAGVSLEAMLERMDSDPTLIDCIEHWRAMKSVVVKDLVGELGEMTVAKVFNVTHDEVRRRMRGIGDHQSGARLGGNACVGTLKAVMAYRQEHGRSRLRMFRRNDRIPARIEAMERLVADIRSISAEARG